MSELFLSNANAKFTVVENTKAIYRLARVPCHRSFASRTVKFHTTHIYGKLGGLSRAETIAWAWKNGLVNGDEA